MARLSKDDWSKVKAKWLTGKYSNREIAEEFGTSHTAIQKKAKNEQWEKLDQEIIDIAIEAKANFNKEVSKVSKVSKVESKHLEAEIDHFATLKNELVKQGVEIVKANNEIMDKGTKQIASIFKSTGEILVEDIQLAPQDHESIAKANFGLYNAYFNTRSTQIGIQNNTTSDKPSKVQIVRRSHA